MLSHDIHKLKYNNQLKEKLLKINIFKNMC